MEDLEKIKDRIAKLMRMAKDASSPNEASIAAQRARSLMDKHQLDEFDVTGRAEDQFGSSQATRMYGAVPLFLSSFAIAIAKYNDCIVRYEFGILTRKKSIEEGAKGKCITFFGYKNDVELATNMFKNLCDVVDRLCKDYMKSRGFTKYDVRIGGAFKRAALIEIANRLSAMTIERDSLTTSAGTSLILMKSSAVAEHFGEAKYETRSSKSYGGFGAFQASVHGAIAGSTVKILTEVAR